LQRHLHHHCLSLPIHRHHPVMWPYSEDDYVWFVVKKKNSRKRVLKVAKDAAAAV